ncbi:uncharacterized protein LOC111073643 [Drosophila obscura]|uniref:uncharacterized protein LOC111073643 n=1 Tax=Drosophila obscura TaxID=7282 RepID=UPI001BB1F49F|nr:uncharacterized protein LOC111073643 [Drosophila obscura]
MRMATSYQFALTFALVLGHVQLPGMVLARVHSQVHRRSNMTRLTPAHTHHMGSNNTLFGQDRRLNYTSSVPLPKNVTGPVSIVNWGQPTYNQTWPSHNYQPGFDKSSQASVYNQTWMYTNQTYYSSAPDTKALHQSSEVRRHVPTSSMLEIFPSGIFRAENNTHVGNSSSGWHHSDISLASVASTSNFTNLPLARGSKPYTSSPYANMVY